MKCETCSKPSNLMVASKAMCWDCWEATRKNNSKELEEFFKDYGFTVPMAVYDFFVICHTKPLWVIRVRK